jgi:hypothetical protein
MKKDNWILEQHFTIDVWINTETGEIEYNENKGAI